MKHTAMVPKGFIRYHVLESLSRKPMSGSEIMGEIENTTEGRWKPSPGSVYPLLSWLQDNGYVKEMPSDQSGMKRYELTDSGRGLLEEQRKIRKRFREEARLMPPPFLGALWFRIPPKKTAEVRKSMQKLMCEFFELGANLEESLSEEALKETRDVFDEATRRIEKINQKLKGEKS